MTRRTFYVLLIGMVAAILRLWYLGDTLLWYDESFSLLVSRLPFDQLIAATLGDVHPPLYYLLAWPFALLPWQPAGLRLFSVLCSLASLYVLWCITGRLGMREPARLLALALVAIWPVELYYAQEARMYALMQLCVLLAWLSALERRWWLVGVWCTCALYTHNFSGFYVAILAACVSLAEVLRPNNFFVPPAGPEPGWTPPPHFCQIRRCLLAFAAPFVLFAPWLVAVWTVQVPGISAGGGYWLDYMTLGSALLNTANILVTPQGTNITDPLSVILMAVGVPVLLWHALKTKRYTMALLAIGPMLAVALISVLWRPVYLNRGFFPSVPVFLVLLADWFAAQRWPRRAFAIGLIAPALLSAYLVWISTGASGIRTMSVDYAGGLALDPLPVVHMDDSTVVIWMANRPELEHYLLRSDCPEEPGSLTERTRRALGFRNLTADQLPDSYYLVAVANIFSSQCMLDRNDEMEQGSEQVFSTGLLFGELGVFQHATR